MKKNRFVFTCLGFAVLFGCQTEAGREKDARRLQELGALSARGFCADPTLSEAKKIANRGNGMAAVLVASCYEKGVGVRTDLEEAMQWYRKAQNAGYAPAAHSIEKLKACMTAKQADPDCGARKDGQMD